MKLQHGAWVVAADGAKALFLENHGDADIVDLRVRRAEEIDNPPAREHGADRPGRFPSPGARRSAVEEADWHDLEEARFAEHLAERINTLARDVAALALIADPRTLGVIREHLSDATRAKIVLELDRDLAHHTVEAIEQALAAA